VINATLPSSLILDLRLSEVPVHRIARVSENIAEV
jgi:hypothetical protein